MRSMTTQDDRSQEGKESYQPVTEEEVSEGQRDDAPNPETGVGIGMMDEPTTFEPEEDPEAAGN